MCVCIGKIELQKGASSKVANLESIFANYAQSLLTVYSAYKGAFNNYVDRISPFFDPPAWTVFIPPHLVYVVIEWPLRVNYLGDSFRFRFYFSLD